MIPLGVHYTGRDRVKVHASEIDAKLARQDLRALSALFDDGFDIDARSWVFNYHLAMFSEVRRLPGLTRRRNNKPMM